MRKDIARTEGQSHWTTVDCRVLNGWNPWKYPAYRKPLKHHGIEKQPSSLLGSGEIGPSNIHEMGDL